MICRTKNFYYICNAIVTNIVEIYRLLLGEVKSSRVVMVAKFLGLFLLK